MCVFLTKFEISCNLVSLVYVIVHKCHNIDKRNYPSSYYCLYNIFHYWKCVQIYLIVLFKLILSFQEHETRLLTDISSRSHLKAFYFTESFSKKHIKFHLLIQNVIRAELYLQIWKPFWKNVIFDLVIISKRLALWKSNERFLERKVCSFRLALVWY